MKCHAACGRRELVIAAVPGIAFWMNGQSEPKIQWAKLQTMVRLQRCLVSQPNMPRLARLFVLKARNEVAGGKRRFAVPPPECVAKMIRVPKGREELMIGVATSLFRTSKR
jgi:hypothetical protein